MTVSSLPAAWLTILHDLRPAGLPRGEVPPIDVDALLAELHPLVTVQLGWEVLLAQARQEALPDTARALCWTQERVRQTLSRAQRQLRWMARDRPEGETLWTWAATPRVVAVPDHDEGWGVLVNALQGRDRLELRTVRLAPGCWAVYRSEAAPYTFRHATVPLGAALPAAQAAAHLGLSVELLETVWPSTGVQPLQNGLYVSGLSQWSSAQWLNLLITALAQAGVEVWEEALLFRAYRALLSAPDVRDGTLRAGLRRSPQVTRGPRAGLWVTAETQSSDCAGKGMGLSWRPGWE